MDPEWLRALSKSSLVMFVDIEEVRPRLTEYLKRNKIEVTSSISEYSDSETSSKR